MNMTFLEYLHEEQLEEASGEDNEQALIAKLREMLKGHSKIDIMFVSDEDYGLKEFKCTNVCEIEDSHRDIRGNKKADVCLRTADNKFYPLSLKKENATWLGRSPSVGKDWPTTTRFKEVLSKATNDKTITVSSFHTINPNTGKRVIRYKLSNGISWKMPTEQKKRILFGTDITKNGTTIDDKVFLPGCILVESFDNNIRVSKDNGTSYKIRVKCMLQTVEHALEYDDIIWTAENDVTRQGGAEIMQDDDILIDGKQIPANKIVKLNGIAVRGIFKTNKFAKGIKEITF